VPFENEVKELVVLAELVWQSKSSSMKFAADARKKRQSAGGNGAQRIDGRAIPDPVAKHKFAYAGWIVRVASLRLLKQPGGRFIHAVCLAEHTLERGALRVRGFRDDFCHMIGQPADGGERKDIRGGHQAVPNSGGRIPAKLMHEAGDEQIHAAYAGFFQA
jgi:hypothetical protein